jgi:hypothetical protein
MTKSLKTYFNIIAGVFLQSTNNAVVNVKTEVAPIRVVNKLQKVRAVSKK